MESLVWISQPFLSTFPVGNQSAQRKLTTSTDRLLTHMLHERLKQECVENEYNKNGTKDRITYSIDSITRNVTERVSILF